MCIRQSTDETSNTKTQSHSVETRNGPIVVVVIVIDEKESRGLLCLLEPKHLISVIGQVKSYSFGAL